jgi:hypothetical protein
MTISPCYTNTNNTNFRPRGAKSKPSLVRGGGGDFSYRFYCVFLCIKLKCMCKPGFIGGEIGVFP